MMERQIKIAINRLNGEIIDAVKHFRNIPISDRFKFRKDYNEGITEFECYECGQNLIVSKSKFNNIYFRHFPNHEPCPIVGNEFTKSEFEIYSNILKSKESDRHKELKNKIGEILRNTEGIDKSSIAIDNRFIIKGNEKRRPDVYCKYFDKEIVFEIQLSELSLKYILSRKNFYKYYGIYLIWILDGYDVKDQATMEKDIKYLTDKQNFFKVETSNGKLGVHCDYKVPILTDFNELRTPWRSSIISISQLQFDPSEFQVYFFNYYERYRELIKIQEERKRQEPILNAQKKCKWIIEKIKRFKGRYLDYSEITEELDSLSELEGIELNKLLNLKNKNSNPVIEWLEKAEGNSYQKFIIFILSSFVIELDINQKDKYGRSVFQVLLKKGYKPNNSIYELIFMRGYKIQSDDLEIYNSIPDPHGSNKNKLLLFLLYNQLTNRMLVNYVSKKPSVFLTIESAKKHKMIGFAYKDQSWIELANNALIHHSEYWDYFNKAFHIYGLWQKILDSDKKGSFRKLLKEHNEKDPPVWNSDLDETILDLYPELNL